MPSLKSPNIQVRRDGPCVPHRCAPRGEAAAVCTKELTKRQMNDPSKVVKDAAKKVKRQDGEMKSKKKQKGVKSGNRKMKDKQ